MIDKEIKVEALKANQFQKFADTWRISWWMQAYVKGFLRLCKLCSSMLKISERDVDICIRYTADFV